MAKPTKYKGETIFNYIPDYLPTFNVDNPVNVKLPPDRKDSRLKDVERELIEYWDLLHPMVREFLIMVIKYVNEFGEGSDDLEHLRRSLDIELSNSAELSDENRKLKSQVSDLLIEKNSGNQRQSHREYQSKKGINSCIHQGFDKKLVIEQANVGSDSNEFELP